MTKKEEVKQIILKNIKKTNPDKITGGQSCGLMSSKVLLISEDANIKIEIGYYRSSLKNYETAMILMELAIDSFISDLKV